jgi:hypothetical protein
MICKEFIIKDILDYEVNNDINIMRELEQCNLFIVIDLIKMGNKCSDEEAIDIMNSYLENMSLEQLCIELVYEVIGRKPSEDDKDCIDNKEVKSLTDLFHSFYNSVQTVDNKLSLSEFWNISTKYLYEYADGVQQRAINDTNKHLREQYNDTAMLMSALAGKLKECPQLNDDGTLHKESLEDKLKKLYRR